MNLYVCDPISLAFPDMQLNNDRVYLLPDGRETIARRVDGSGYHLFDPRLGPAAADLFCWGRGKDFVSGVDRFPGKLRISLTPVELLKELCSVWN